MGEAIQQTKFSKEEVLEFKRRLREETKFLKGMFDSRAFAYRETPRIGLEVEAWLLNRDFLPNPINSQFLQITDHPLVVEELAKFNFELNTEPLDFAGRCFSQLEHQLKSVWQACRNAANNLDSEVCMVGIHPLVSEELLQLKFMSDGGRYKALNDSVIDLRQGNPIQINIEGVDQMRLQSPHVMLEAAATSIQIHIQANQENIKRVLNASMIASAPMVAIAANSPFFCGKNLWDETRIPLFEQSIRVNSFRNKKGEDVGRVTFGTGYVRNSLMEIFLENLDGYPPLISVLFDEKPECLHHLRFHNGTLWRWNRPIIGFNSTGEPHLRVEQRVMASGPSLVDVVANAAFSVGLTQFLSEQSTPPEQSMTFTDCSKNFYAAAKQGLAAKVRWLGREVFLDRLILDELLDKAKQGLISKGIDNSEIEFYLDEIIKPRVNSRQNGAQWQRSFIEAKGRDFQGLAKIYNENQHSGKPVHLWQV